MPWNRNKDRIHDRALELSEAGTQGIEHMKAFFRGSEGQGPSARVTPKGYPAA